MASKPSIKNTLIKNCEAAGTYRPSADKTIELLTGILKRHEKVLKEWKADGEPILITEVNTKGEPYTKKDPRIDILAKLEDQALRYLSALGLTPKSADDNNVRKASKSTLSDFMEKALKNAGME